MALIGRGTIEVNGSQKVSLITGALIKIN